MLSLKEDRHSTVIIAVKGGGLDKIGANNIGLLEAIGAKQIRATATVFNAPYILAVNIGVGGISEETGASGEAISLNIDLKDIGHGLTTGT